ncbi:MAG: histidine kinase [Bacteroidia bacterium]
MVNIAYASILLEYGSLNEAEDAIRKAHDYYEQSGNESRRAVCLNNWGIILNELNKPKEAIKKFSEALTFRLQEQPEVPHSIARVYYGLGVSSQIMGDPGTATDHYLKAYEYRKKVNSIAVAEVLTGIATMMYDAAEQGQDTMVIFRKIVDYGFPSSTALLDSCMAIPGVAERSGFLGSIKSARRKYYVLQGNYEKAYALLAEEKRSEEEEKLSASSLEAFADLKIKNEKDQLKIRLLEEEVNNRKSQNQVNLLLLSLGIALLALISGFLIYTNRQKANNLLLAEARREQQIIAIRSMLEGQEKERARIARDLHDGLGNLLSTLKVRVESIEGAGENGLGEASEMIDEACSEVRKISHEMMPQALKALGLRKALADLVLKMESTHGVQVSFQTYGAEKELDDNANVMVFRMVQELFNNVLKHAEATEVLLQLTYSEDWFNITVEDNGKGFDLQQQTPDQGMGLQSIAFRAEYIGGEYTIDSRPGMGTSVSINVPLKQMQS